MKRTIALALTVSCVLLFGSGGVGWAGSRDRGNSDHERARAALQRGEILPIARILALVAQYLPGDIIEVELDERRGRFYYEITVLTPTGRVRELVLDASNGALVRIED